MVNRPLDVLDRLVKELNDYNQHDMLDGYLNSLAELFNDELKLLGLPIIEKVGEDE